MAADLSKYDPKDIEEAKQAYQEYLAHYNQPFKSAPSPAQPDGGSPAPINENELLYNQYSQHPKFSFNDRFISQNLASSPEKQLEYVKQQHPEMDVKLVDGMVYGKDKDEKQYKALAPNMIGLQSLTDKAHLLPDIAIQGGATALGSLAGPGGTIAGGAAGSAADEYLKQKLGEALGIKGNVNPGQILTSGLIGGAIPAAGEIGKAAYNEVKPFVQETVAPAIRNAADFIPRKFSKFTKPEQSQFLNNPEAVNEWTKLFEDRANPDSENAAELAKKALGVFENGYTAVKNKIKSNGEALDALHMGKTATYNPDLIERAAAPLNSEVVSYDPYTQRPNQTVQDLLDILKKAKETNTPPKPLTKEDFEVGLQGLNNPSKIVEPEVNVSSSEQPPLFESQPVNKPNYTSMAAEQPKAPSETLLEEQKLAEPTDQNLENYYKWKESYDKLAPSAKNPRQYVYRKNPADMPVPPDESLLQTQIVDKTPEGLDADLAKYLQQQESREKFEQPQLPQEQQANLLPSTGQTVTKQSGAITPSSSEYFPTQSAGESVLQDILPLNYPAHSDYNTSAPASVLRQLRKKLEDSVSYVKQNPQSSLGGRVNNPDELSMAVRNLREGLNTAIPEQAPINSETRQLYSLLENKLNPMMSNPISSLGTNSGDKLADMALIDNLTGSKLLEQSNQVGAAKKILGLNEGNNNNKIKRSLHEYLGRKGLQANQGIANTINAAGDLTDQYLVPGAVNASRYVPGSLYLDMLKQQQQQGK